MMCFDGTDGPLVKVAAAEVYVGYDQQAEISCIVRANPTSEVTWVHNDTTPINAFDNANVFVSMYNDLLLDNRLDCFVVIRN